MSTLHLDRTSSPGDLDLAVGSVACSRGGVFAPPPASDPPFAGHGAPERADAR